MPVFHRAPDSLRSAARTAPPPQARPRSYVRGRVLPALALALLLAAARGMPAHAQRAASGGGAAQAAPTTAQKVLHQGAAVRVRVPRLGTGWLPATVVQTGGAHPCLAFQLARTDASGRAQFVFLSAVRAVEVDRRTNEGVLVGGLPPATAEDWKPIDLAALRRQDAGCRRR